VCVIGVGGGGLLVFTADPPDKAAAIRRKIQLAEVAAKAPAAASMAFKASRGLALYEQDKQCPVPDNASFSSMGKAHLDTKRMRVRSAKRNERRSQEKRKFSSSNNNDGNTRDDEDGKGISSMDESEDGQDEDEWESEASSGADEQSGDGVVAPSQFDGEYSAARGSRGE
jgi:hypothetical protein